MIDIIKEEKKPAVILVGLNTDRDEDLFESSMLELRGLCEAAGMKVCATLTQNAESPVQATFVGSGKVEEIKARIEYDDADAVIFNQTLSPMQIRNLEKILDREVIDRTALILLIFADRARTREARLQVEVARLQYLLPRLSHMRKGLTRQGGASGSKSSKGAGEKQLELDKRRIEHRLAELRRELEAVNRERSTQRNRRLSSSVPKVALVGYTNAGKSTIMNHLLTNFADGNTDDKKVLEQDMLFATLDTTVRKISPAGHRSFLLSDTVGFIDDLPTTLVKAFRSTLEEIKYADVLLEVIDFSDPDYNRHMEVTDKTLSEIGAGDIPKIYVFNKSDIADEQGSTMVQLPYVRDHRIYMAAKKDIGTEELLSLIDKVLLEGSQECELTIPYSQGAIVAAILDGSEVLNTEYLPEGTRIKAKLKKQDINKYAEYISSTS